MYLPEPGYLTAFGVGAGGSRFHSLLDSRRDAGGTGRTSANVSNSKVRYGGKAFMLQIQKSVMEAVRYIFIFKLTMLI